MYPKHIFQDRISSFPVLLAFEFLGCGGHAMPEAWWPTFLDSIPQILVAAPSLWWPETSQAMAKNALKSKIYAQLRMSALYLVNFQVKITKKTDCPKSSSTTTDWPPALTSPLIAQEREADEGPAVDSAPHSCHGQASLTPLASCDTVPSWLAAPLYSQHHSEAVALVD